MRLHLYKKETIVEVIFISTALGFTLIMAFIFIWLLIKQRIVLYENMRFIAFLEALIAVFTARYLIKKLYRIVEDDRKR